MMLVIDLNKWGLGGLMPTPTTVDTDLLELVHSTLEVLINLFWNIREAYPIRLQLVWANQRMCQPLSKIQPLVEYLMKTVRSGPRQVTILERGRAYKMYHCIWLVKC
jgi:hypothetical protein